MGSVASRVDVSKQEGFSPSILKPENARNHLHLEFYPNNFSSAHSARIFVPMAAIKQSHI